MGFNKKKYNTYTMEQPIGRNNCLPGGPRGVLVMGLALGPAGEGVIGVGYVES